MKTGVGEGGIGVGVTVGFGGTSVGVGLGGSGVAGGPTGAIPCAATGLMAATVAAAAAAVAAGGSTGVAEVRAREQDRTPTLSIPMLARKNLRREVTMFAI